MDNKRADIEQIQKYLNGELDAKAMYRLEREAQDDSFLMDALEGYGRTKAKQQDNLAALQQRLQERTAVKTRRIIPWQVISIAASVVGFAIIIGLLYKSNRPAETAKIAVAQPLKKAPVDTSSVFTDKKVLPNAIAQSPQVALTKPEKAKRFKAALEPIERTNTPQQLNEVAVEHMYAYKKATDSTSLEDRIMGYMAAKRQDTILGGDKIATTNSAWAPTPLNSKAQGAEMTARSDKPGNSNPYMLSRAGLPSNLLTGVVLDRTNGGPIPGATVKVVGKSIGTQTDVNGKFTLPNVKRDERISVGFIGYNGQTLGVNDNDSLKVELDASTSALSEVVVVPNAKKRNVTYAQPRAGWDSYKKYLKDNAVSTDVKTGTVELVVTVNANGTISNIRISKSLSSIADAKAISLIKGGPAWNGNTNGRPQEVKIRVEFDKQR